MIVAIANDSYKDTLFNIDERVCMAQDVFRELPQVTVESFSGLLVDYVERTGSKVIIRGMRAVADFEYEFQLALLNRKLKRGIQTMFLMTDYQWLFTSSSIVKNAAKLGCEIRGLVPDPIYRALRQKFGYPYPING